MYDQHEFWSIFKDTGTNTFSTSDVFKKNAVTIKNYSDILITPIINQKLSDTSSNLIIIFLSRFYSDSVIFKNISEFAKVLHRERTANMPTCKSPTLSNVNGNCHAMPRPIQFFYSLQFEILS